MIAIATELPYSLLQLHTYVGAWVAGWCRRTPADQVER
jgi:hypothetical protein